MQRTYLGVARLAAGDRAGALIELEESARNRDFDLAGQLDSYEALRGEPRYEAVRQLVFGARAASRHRP